MSSERSDTRAAPNEISLPIGVIEALPQLVGAARRLVHGGEIVVSDTQYTAAGTIPLLRIVPSSSHDARVVSP